MFLPIHQELLALHLLLVNYMLVVRKLKKPQNKMLNYQDFHFQAVESASCGSVDSGEPCCHEPPEEDTGRVNNDFAFRLPYIYSMPA